MKNGFSLQRLSNVDAYLRRLVDTKQTAGVGAYIVRHGEEAYFKSFGMQDVAASVPMQNDSIYRIFSMSKTFTIVTAMTLYEKGLFKLHDPIAEFLPAFSDMKVARHDERGGLLLESAKRPITFEHLFTMTSGLPYPGEESYSARAFKSLQAKVDSQAATAGVPLSFADRQAKLDTVAMANMAATVPLCFQPGEFWMYGFSHDILGALIEVISGKRLGAYMAEAVIDPLGLSDTAFFVSAEKRPRLAKAYDVSVNGLAEKKGLEVVPSEPPVFESGGAGLMSTMRDVGKFGLMLLNSGKLPGGERVLSRKTIDLIRENHCSPSQNIPRYGFPSMAGYGYGLGVRTMLDTAAAGLNGSVGEWAWDGMLGTWYCVDPAEDMVAVFMVQRYPGGNEDLPKRFAQTVYGAIDD